MNRINLLLFYRTKRI